MASTQKPGTRAGWRFHLTLLALSGVVFGGLVLFLRSLEHAATAAIRDQLDPMGQPRPVAEVARAIASLKLVTVEIDSSVARTAEDDNWRGLVSARVEAPVRLLFGVDLSAMSVDRLSPSPVTGEWVVRVPPVTRIATEVFGEHERSAVQLGWARFKSIDGEPLLGEARRGLSRRARELALPPEVAERVVETTRLQVESMVRTILGPAARVRVIFDDAIEPTPLVDRGSMPR